MKSFALVSALAAASVVNAGPLQARATVETITTSGNAFFKGKDRFYMRGIDYQPGGSAANLDPLADTKICLQDIKNFEKLGVNVIRVYSVDNSKTHKECMEALAKAGIYLVLDVNNPEYSVTQLESHGSYNTNYLQNVFATIDEFAQYDNTMAFFSGNEVIHDKIETTLSAPYVKATTRDMRRYMKARGHRQIPVGYSAADVSTNRMQAAAYFNCGSDEERSDFFGFNDYSWCTSDYITSGWDQKVKNFTGYGLPIFLSEYGCIQNKRNFGELESLMHSNMTGVYSGGIMYEYTYEDNKYGIVSIQGGGTGKTDQTGKRVENDDFAAFQSALKKFPAPKGDGGYTKTTKASKCPPADEHWDVNTTELPKIPKNAEKYFTEGAGKGPGLKGPGSIWATYEASESFGGDGSGLKGNSGGTAAGNGTKGGDDSAGGEDKDNAAAGTVPAIGTALAAFLALVAFL